MARKQDCEQVVKQTIRRYREEILLRSPPRDHMEEMELNMYKTLLSDFESALLGEVKRSSVA